MVRVSCYVNFSFLSIVLIYFFVYIVNFCFKCYLFLKRGILEGSFSVGEVWAGILFFVRCVVLSEFFRLVFVFISWGYYNKIS